MRHPMKRARPHQMARKPQTIFCEVHMYPPHDNEREYQSFLDVAEVLLGQQHASRGHLHPTKQQGEERRRDEPPDVRPQSGVRSKQRGETQRKGAPGAREDPGGQTQSEDGSNSVALFLRTPRGRNEREGDLLTRGQSGTSRCTTRTMPPGEPPARGPSGRTLCR